MVKQIPLTQGKFALVDDEDFEYLNQWKWYYNKKGYANRGVLKKEKDDIFGNKGNISMHRALVKCSLKSHIDHINRNGLDNRRSNLRVCTVSQNHINRPMTKRNSSGYKGVGRVHNGTKWRADIRKDQKQYYLGSFDTKEEAAKAYNEMAIEMFGDFAWLNDVE
jgi:hypothetical protein